MPRTVIIALFTVICGPFVVNGQMNMDEVRKAFVQKHLSDTFEPEDSSPPEIVKIAAALEHGDAALARQLCIEILDKPDAAPGESPQFKAWVRSLAYKYRAKATYQLTQDWRKSISDLKQAAGIGNINAVLLLTALLVEAKAYPSAVDGYQPTDDELREAFTIAADLVIVEPLAMLGNDKVPPVFRPEKLMYWKLLAQVNFGHVRPLVDFVRENREWPLVDILAKEALLGAPLPLTPGGLPGRDIIATVFVDYQLRRELGASLGARAPRKKTAEAPSVKENFLMFAADASKRGFADIYLSEPIDDASRKLLVREILRGIIYMGLLWRIIAPSHGVSDQGTRRLTFLDRPNV